MVKEELNRIKKIEQDLRKYYKFKELYSFFKNDINFEKYIKLYERKEDKLYYEIAKLIYYSF